MSASPSYELINYSVRTAKNIERKILAESLLRLERIRPLSDYRYVGFGGIFFTDFLIFHRILGIDDMVSIEEDVAAAERLEFNRPLGGITIKPGQSTVVLGDLEWDRPVIVWLDYDQAISSSILADVEFAISVLPADSVLLVSVNAHPPALTGKVGERVAWLRGRIGEDLMPSHVTSDAHLNQKKLPAVSKGLIDGAIARGLADRSRGLPDPRKIAYSQLFNFEYADGARMLTVGGIVAQAGEMLARLDAFSDLAHIRESGDAHELRVPVLTPRERLHLARQLPCALTSLQEPGIPEKDLQDFVTLHRHYPNYLDVPQ